RADSVRIRMIPKSEAPTGSLGFSPDRTISFRGARIGITSTWAMCICITAYIHCRYFPSGACSHMQPILGRLVAVSQRRRQLPTWRHSGYIVITMTIDLIRIGNSKGIRIPKPVIEQCGFKDKVQLQVEKDRLVISPARRPRQGWADAFQRMTRA